MADARRCDVCGEFYDIPENVTFRSEPYRVGNFIRVYKFTIDKAKTTNYGDHDTMHFDACENCLQDVIDFMLARRAEKEKGELND